MANKSQILIKSDSSDWVISEIKRELIGLFKNDSFIDLKDYKLFKLIFAKRIFLLNKFDLIKFPKFLNIKIIITIFHLVDTDVNFNNQLFRILINDKRIHKILIPNTIIQNKLIKNNIDQKKIILIPILINSKHFIQITEKNKIYIKKKYSLPTNKKIIGSFQKDGNGWNHGNKPKMIKGPDIFIKSISKISQDFNIFVLLTGPSRGYVKNNLKKLKIPFKHLYFDDYSKIIQLYYCLDLYIVASREEGGPRAILESMAAMVPIISTKVGQAIDLIQHKKNGYLVEIGDFKGIYKYAKIILSKKANKQLTLNAKITSKKYSYIEQKKNFYKLFN